MYSWNLWDSSIKVIAVYWKEDRINKTKYNSIKRIVLQRKIESILGTSALRQLLCVERKIEWIKQSTIASKEYKKYSKFYLLLFVICFLEWNLLKIFCCEGFWSNGIYVIHVVCTAVSNLVVYSRCITESTGSFKSRKKSPSIEIR